MKNKLLIIIAIVFSFFAFKNKVSAISNEMRSDYAFDLYNKYIDERLSDENGLYNDSFDNIDNAIKREYEKVKDVYPYYFVNFLCNQEKNCRAIFYLFKDKPNITFYYFYSNSKYYYNIYNNSDTSFNYLTATYYFGNGFSTLSSQINFDKLTNGSINSESNLYQHFSDNTYIRYENKTYSHIYPMFIYDSNFDIKKGKSPTNTNFDFKIGDKYYQENDVLPTYKETLKTNPQKYVFDNTIHDENIAQTYFNLDLQQLQNNDYNLNLKYAYGNYTSNILAPYLKITYDDNTNSYISITTDEKPIVNVFMGSFETCLDNSKSISNVQVVFPMENTKDIDYKIQLESNIKFDISYVYDEVFNSHLQTVDITGKYSVNFIPKLVANNSDVFQDFYLVGNNFEIRILHNIDADIQNAINTVYKNWDRTTFRYFEGINQITNAIQFINNDYENYPLKTYSVTYDTRYWTYSIFEKRDSVILVTNPNTGVTNTWDAAQITQNIYTKIEYSDFNLLYSTLKDFVDNNESSVNLVTLSMFNIFDTCPYYIKNLFFIIILFSIIACFISFLGWK